MIRNASLDDLPALRDLFARANDGPYDLSVVAFEKCFGDGVSGAPVTRVFLHDGAIAGAATMCGKFLRILVVDRTHRRRGIGSALLADASPIVIAAEAGNYFTPGVVDSDADTLQFFASHGYVETRSTFNLHAADLDTIEAPIGPRRVTEADRDRVLDFIEREFGRIWRFEAARGVMFFLEIDHDIAGFSAHEANNRGLGWFGPTGVAKSMRNRGLGRQLLLASLADLRALGHRRAIIAWTDALAFYAKACGATPAHRFVTLQKP
ncbi:MAG TPA: GNAT family N-acetyltransferase [Thermoanaerobaculia bacterium]|nr:GNAT family N-acetyltransferase [Thermoanaerobaculia bacterium]